MYNIIDFFKKFNIYYNKILYFFNTILNKD